MTFVHGTFVLGTFVHNSNISIPMLNTFDLSLVPICVKKNIPKIFILIFGPEKNIPYALHGLLEKRPFLAFLLRELEINLWPGTGVLLSIRFEKFFDI